MDRKYYLQKIYQAFNINPIVAILGPRQCGKTTLSRMFIEEQKNIPLTNLFDLDKTSDMLRLADPEFTLEQLEGWVIIDEIQKIPALFDTLRVLVDRPNQHTKFLILGSASRHLIQHSANSLAGRISYIELTPFTAFETKEVKLLFTRGGYPKSYLANSEEDSFEWLQNYIRTYLEHDIPNLGLRISAASLRRFWVMLTHYHGNIFNASELGRALSLSYHTVQDYLDILINTFMVRKLTPWFENISKRQTKSPKLYFRDTGLLFALLGAENTSMQLLHPKLGSVWEGFALEQIIQAIHVSEENCYFWATHAHAEIDLVIFHKTKKLGFEFKYGSAVKVTRSMQIALQDLQLDQIYVIHAGVQSYPLGEKIHAYSLIEFCLNPPI